MPFFTTLTPLKQSHLTGHFQIWQFLAGLGIFLMAMTMLEGALEQLAGRAFKQFLRRHTQRPLKAILAGIGVTVVLQSSAVVSLMAVAFVGAGIIELSNAVGIILGANLGTTFTGWIVATLGFSFSVDKLALPLIGLGGLAMAYTNSRWRLHDMGRLILGFGLLFLGLNFMKTSVSDWAQSLDISPFAHWYPMLLAPLGFALAAIIQSSSATMVIALSALNAGVLDLESAAALAVGGDLGTTMTVLIGGFKGSAAKKRVAFSHFFFNLIVDLSALALLFPLLEGVKWALGNTNPLVVLVAFHSTFNLLGIVLFVPFLKKYAQFLERRFHSGDQSVSRFIKEVPPNVPEAVVEALMRESQHLLSRVLALHWRVLQLPPDESPALIRPFSGMSSEAQYELIKELEGEMAEVYARTQEQTLDKESADRLNKANNTIRHAMSAAKDVKDIHHNVHDFYKSVNDDLLYLFQLLADQQRVFYQKVLQWLAMPPTKQTFNEVLPQLKQANKDDYHAFLQKAYELIRFNKFSDIEISTIFNVNRELHASNKDLLTALREWMET